MIRATWCLSNNVGDALTAWIVHRLTGEWPLYIPPAMGNHQPRAMLSGSILNHAQQNTTVAGAGVARLSDAIDARCKVLALRGPLSRQAFYAQGGRCPEVYGDPGLLLPEWIYPAPRTDVVGIVPHYTDHARTLAWWGDHIQAGRMRLINVFAPVEEVIRDVTSCSGILSSSLHGLVFADAYGIPSQWVKIDENMIGGDGTKYRDHALAMGYELEHPVELVGEPPARLAALPVQRPEFTGRAALLAAVREAIRLCA